LQVGVCANAQKPQKHSTRETRREDKRKTNKQKTILKVRFEFRSQTLDHSKVST
jgi:hypothetical protein